jgi:hypothetical protein
MPGSFCNREEIERPIQERDGQLDESRRRHGEETQRRLEYANRQREEEARRLEEEIRRREGM